MKNYRNLLINIVLLLIGTLMGLAMAETALRIAGYSAPIFREPDAILGWRGTANLEGSHRIENVTYNRFNSQGYHDGDHDKAKPPGTLRIAIVGDSFVQASEVLPADHFVSFMETKLNARFNSSDRKVEIINFGVSGFSTAQELILLKTEVLEYQPDLVVLMAYPGNDIIDNSYELTTTLRDMRPYFVMNAEGALARKPGFPDQSQIAKNALLMKVINHSRLLQFSKEAIKRLRLKMVSNHSKGAGENRNREDDVFLDPPSDLWKEAWNISEMLMAQFAKETVASGADFLMAIIAIPIQVHPLTAGKSRFMTALGLKTLDYPSLRLAAFAKRSGLPSLSLVEPFRNVAATGVYLHGFDEASLGEGHWNVQGHLLAAELLVERISGRVLPKLSDF